MEHIIGHDLVADGTTTTTNNPISILVVLLVRLAIKLQHYCLQFHWFFINGVAEDGGNNDQKLLKSEKGCEVLTQSRMEDRDESELSTSEVKMVMERLGILGSAYYYKSLEGGDRMMKAGEIARLFEEEEVRLDEIKEAFYVFDENCDGLIDARELREVLVALGMWNVEESDCRELIRNFDENGDGFIDFREFTKLVERSFLK